MKFIANTCISTYLPAYTSFRIKKYSRYLYLVTALSSVTNEDAFFLIMLYYTFISIKVLVKNILIFQIGYLWFLYRPLICLHTVSKGNFVTSCFKDFLRFNVTVSQ